MNSLDVATKEALLDAVRQVADDPAVRCVRAHRHRPRLLRRPGPQGAHRDPARASSSESLFRTVDEHYNPIVTALATMAKPVIAAVNGVAAGAGASLAFACDLRILADTAGFNLAFANVALSCDTGASYHLQRLVGPGEGDRAALLPAHDQGRRGLARARPGHPGGAGRRARRHRARDRGPARRPARRSRSARCASRWPSPPATRFEDSLAFESTKMELTGATRDHRAAVAAFVAKEKPVFEGR